MSISQNATQRSPQASAPWRVALWTAQVLLFVLFGMAGVMKSFVSPQALVGMGITYATQIPYWLLRFIGICEAAGAIGVVLPALTRIRPGLTPLAPLGFVTIQILAIGFHVVRGEIASSAPLNALLLGLSLFVLWGRTKKAPISPRT